MSKLGKRMTNARDGVDREKLYPRPEAVKMITERAKAPGRDKAGSVTKAQVKEIAEQKMKDLNCDTIESAMKMIEGSARSMGLQVEG